MTWVELFAGLCDFLPIADPANKNSEDPSAVTDPDHLQAFQITEAREESKHESQTNLLVRNQFGDLRVDTIKPSRLLVPSAKSETEPVPEPTLGIDHFKCYTVVGKLPKGVQAIVVNQFSPPISFSVGPQLFDVVKPTRLCTPVDKDGETPGAEDHSEHLMCYLVRPAKQQPVHERVIKIYVNNQFGMQVLNTLQEEELCLPSLKIVP